MSSEDLSVRRAALTMAVKKALESKGFGYEVKRTDLMTVFNIRDPNFPDWSGEAIVAVQTNLKPALRLIFDAKFVTSSSGPQAMDTFISKVRESRFLHQQLAKSAAADEAEAQKWAIRQMNELGELEELDWVSYEIIRQGPFAGRYRMRLEAGHPFESMTLGQLRDFHKLCVRCKDNR